MDYIKIEIDNGRIKLQDIYECFWLQYGGITWKNIAHYFVFSFFSRMYLTKLPIIEHTYGINNTENVRLIVKCHSFYASMEKKPRNVTRDIYLLLN